jgi:hypothetical protein
MTSGKMCSGDKMFSEKKARGECAGPKRRD